MGLTPKDITALRHWNSQFAADHREDLLKDISPARREKLNLDSPDESVRRRGLASVAWQRWSRNAALPAVTNAEIERLAGKLSPAAEKALEAKTANKDKVQLIHEWIAAIGQPRFGGGGAAHTGTLVSQEELTRFLEHDLPADERKKLEALSPDDMQRRLRWLYFQHKRSGGSPGSEPMGPGKFDPDHPGSTRPHPTKPPPDRPNPDKNSTDKATEPKTPAASSKSSEPAPTGP